VIAAVERELERRTLDTRMSRRLPRTMVRSKMLSHWPPRKNVRRPKARSLAISSNKKTAVKKKLNFSWIWVNLISTGYLSRESIMVFMIIAAAIDH
jgi:hypothetical protein